MTERPNGPDDEGHIPRDDASPESHRPDPVTTAPGVAR